MSLERERLVRCRHRNGRKKGRNRPRRRACRAGGCVRDFREPSLQRRSRARPRRPAHLDDLQLRGAVDLDGALHPDVHAGLGPHELRHGLEAGPFTILLGNMIVLVPILLNSHPGTKYGIPFPVFARAAYGTAGSNLPALMRALVACGWFGIQAWIGGEALYTFFTAVFPGWPTLLGAGFSGHTTTEWLSFLMFWGLNIFVIYRGMDVLRKVEN